jgi:hypothetical protein
VKIIVHDDEDENDVMKKTDEIISSCFRIVFCILFNQYTYIFIDEFAFTGEKK